MMNTCPYCGLEQLGYNDNCPKCGYNLQGAAPVVLETSSQNLTQGAPGKSHRVANPVRQSHAVSDFFAFRDLIWPKLHRVLYLLGVILGSLWVGYFGYGYAELHGYDPAIRFSAITLAILLFNIVWRVLCEFQIILFSIHERLKEISVTIRSNKRD